MRLKHYINICIVISIILFLAGCAASPRHPKNEKEDNNKDTIITINDNDSTEDGNIIIKTALLERENEMYSPSVDTTILYWLKNKPIFLKNASKCNIFALNTLFKAGYKTPKTNALSKDLFNEDLFQEIMPIVKLKSINDILKGDLVVWKSHVIIFESLLYVKNDPFANGIWAGTSKTDNGTSVKNNVILGKYSLKGDFIVRRPQKEGKSQN